MPTSSNRSADNPRVKALWIGSVLAAGVIHSGASAQTTVDSYQALPVLFGASDAGTIDLDGDGAPEVIVSDDFGNDVYVYWNDGFGWFEDRTLVPIGMWSYWVATGDFDADGDGDAAVGGSAGIISLTNEGERTFIVRGPFFAGPYLFDAPIVVDMNGDGALDLVGPNSTAPVITTVLGTGTGDFVRTGAQPIADIATHIDVRDFDGDGTLDYLALERNPWTGVRRIEVISGLTGLSIQSIPLGLGDGAIALGDYDEDGIVDLAVSNADLYEILLLRGSAGGTFAEVGRLASTKWSAGIVAGDFDSDSHLDLAVTPGSFESSKAIGPTLYRGDGRLGFSMGPTFVTGLAPKRLRAVDLSRDGRLDLLVQLRDTADVAVLLNDGTGLFSQPGVGPAVPPPWGCVTGDFNGDDHADVLVTSFALRQLAFVSGDGTGRFGPATITDGVGSLESPSAGDLDGNGLTDVVATDQSDGRIVIGLVDVAGSFALFDAPPLFPEPSRAGATSLADVDSDGDLDVVASRISGNLTAAGAILLNDGTGDLSPPILIRPGTAYAPAAIGDFDANGSLDLVFGDGSDRLRVFRQIDSSVPTFVELAPIRLGRNTYPADVVLADANGDGAADVLIASFKYGVAVRLGAGDGTFQAQSSYGERSGQILAGDFNRDGALDVASLEKRFELFSGKGMGEFNAGQAYGHWTYTDTANPAAFFDSADFDEDGLADFVVGAMHASVPEHRLTMLFGRDREAEKCRQGNVNAGRGPIADVLFVNDSTGGSERRITLTPGDPFVVFVERTPAATGPEPFALYAWIGEPRRSDASRLPFGIGVTCMPTPASGGEPQPRAIWNNVPRSERWLGAPRFPSSPAPNVVVARPRGPRGPIVFFLQGIIADPGAPNGRAAVTNGVVVDVK